MRWPVYTCAARDYPDTRATHPYCPSVFNGHEQHSADVGAKRTTGQVLLVRTTRSDWRSSKWSDSTKSIPAMNERSVATSCGGVGDDRRGRRDVEDLRGEQTSSTWIFTSHCFRALGGLGHSRTFHYVIIDIHCFVFISLVIVVGNHASGYCSRSHKTIGVRC